MVALAKKPSRLIESLATNELLTDAQKPMVALAKKPSRLIESLLTDAQKPMVAGSQN
jgi:hypothetical protein